MKEKKLLLLLVFSLSSFSAFSATSKTVNREVVEKDNTALNRNNQVTAEAQAKGSKADVEVTRQLRAKLMADDQLSTNAHNIKIITIGKTITLEGPVDNREEKSKIEALARGVATNKKIYNKLTY
ncbi:MAG: BON domain-containing protein [Bacteriovorax sp.]|nr:BON domain-containing protein [Bacteriovorax sp.]